MQVFEVGWWQVCGAAVQAAMVVPVDVFQGSDLDLVAGPPRPSRFDQLGLEQPDLGTGLRDWIDIRHGDQRRHVATLAERDTVLREQGVAPEALAELDTIEDGCE